MHFSAHPGVAFGCSSKYCVNFTCIVVGTNPDKSVVLGHLSIDLLARPDNVGIQGLALTEVDDFSIGCISEGEPTEDERISFHFIPFTCKSHQGRKCSFIYFGY